ncbi:MAG: glycoside hydrolase family 99-like domain-containing protein [Salinivirgaceae bacterium]|nr:glycoside hydrolase family 99-like domain-containing protein [Salinivirgaceae bacterium]
MSKPRVIAFYLPQFHPTEDNNKWYGEGFTEWTNVAKAKKLFRGHEQPHIPSTLGFYDLRLEEIRIKQAEIAKDAGIEGFCYYHYWFAPNKRELEMPFQKVLESGNPDFPFMLCWANETWQKKFWNLDGTYSKEDLAVQTYGGEKDYTIHFYDILPALKDKRYIKIDGKPAFMIYKALQIPDLNRFIDLWQKLALENGLPGIFFIAQSIKTREEKEQILNSGIDAINSVRHYDNYLEKSYVRRKLYGLYRRVFRLPIIKKYDKIFPSFISADDYLDNIFPTIIPNWDHTPRSGLGGYVITNSTPELFGQHLQHVFSVIQQKSENRHVAFLKSWNEWGEGNYMEPDLKYGTQYLDTLKAEIQKYK